MKHIIINTYIFASAIALCFRHNDLKDTSEALKESQRSINFNERVLDYHHKVLESHKTVIKAHDDAIGIMFDHFSNTQV